MKIRTLCSEAVADSGLPRAVAADQISGLVYDILTELRSGRPVHVPGLGTFHRGQKAAYLFRACICEPDMASEARSRRGRL